MTANFFSGISRFMVGEVTAVGFHQDVFEDFKGEVFCLSREIHHLWTKADGKLKDVSDRKLGVFFAN